ncbi:MAG TPA: AsmA-like C-terminal region-containing protein, partial [Alphaproteobacteria bacterium]|nr:AsmA-like C-terminal region-containing protein [Alphaproteobacteria bacterium]
SGNSQKSIIGNLNGNGDVTFKNGAITGIDAVNIAQMIQNGLKDAGVGGGKTEFVEMGGTFTITKGVAYNDDLKLRGPLVQVTGAGNVDLPKKYMKYLVKPVLTASSAEENAGGIRVPVNIVGPFSNIRVKPDFAAAVKDVLKDPAALKEQGKIIEDNFKEMKKDPGKAIENLLGGGGLFGKKPAPAPTPAPEAAPAEGTTTP